MAQPKPQAQEDRIVREAQERPPGERAAFLESTCAGDSALRQRVEARLKVETSSDEASGVTPVGSRRDFGTEEGPGTVIGRYQLLEKIGEGGFGVVYAAEQREPVQRRVALKIIKLGMDTRQVVARFEAERQALAIMDHPNIARVLDAGATGAGRPYFVMELVRGEKISDYCRRNHLSVRQRIELFVQVCRGVQHAHQKGIIHRDLKPSNILVTEDHGIAAPKVIDFGIAKATERSIAGGEALTSMNFFVGTPVYMSPEQVGFGASDVDTRSDIYSLGVILYELLTGKPPLDVAGTHLDEICRTIREVDPPRPSVALQKHIEEAQVVSPRPELKKRVTALRGDLDSILLKCLEKDRTRRYETANGLAADLKRYLDNEPVLACPPSLGYRTFKMWQRHRVSLTAVGVVAVTLIISIVVSSWQAFEANRARLAENRQRLRADAEKADARRLLYGADMNLVQQAWDQNNLGRVRKFLDESASFPERGFEWYYWQRQTHQPLSMFRGHVSAVDAAVWSPDDRRIATVSDDRTGVIWDVATGAKLAVLKGHTMEVDGVAFSPDGKRVATASSDQTARVWDAATGRELLRLKGHLGPVECVAFSPDGRWIATGSQDQTAKIWEAASGRELLTLKGHAGRVEGLAFSPDGRRIVTGGGDLAVKVWDTASGRTLTTLKGHERWLTTAVFSPRGDRVVTASADQTARVWDAATGRELLALRGHTGVIKSASYSPDGTRIVTASEDETARVWNAETGRELFTLKGHVSPVRSAFYSSDGRRILTAGQDQVASIWSAEGDRSARIFGGHDSAILSVAISPDSRRLLTGGEDAMAKIWDLATMKEAFSLSGHAGGIYGAAFSSDRRRIVTASADQTAKIWDAAGGQELATLKGHDAPVFCAAFSPDSQMVATGSADQTVKLWPVAGGKELRTISLQGGPVLSVAFSPDGRRLVSGAGDQMARVWDTASGKELLTLKGHEGPVRSVAFSQDGRWIVTGSEDQTARVWDAATGAEKLILAGHSDQVRSAMFTSDGLRVVTASTDQTVRVWDASTGKAALVLNGHAARVSGAVVSPDGRWIASGSLDRTARVWEAVSSEQVAAWHADDDDAQKRLLPLEQELKDLEKRETAVRVQDPGVIRQWLVLAPIPFEGKSHEAAIAALDREQIAHEAALRPKAGERTQTSKGQAIWRTVQISDYLLDLNLFLGEQMEWNTAYAVCYIQSETPQTGLVIRVGSDDESKMYLNGKPIYRSIETRSIEYDSDSVTGVELNAGLNVLVLKIVNETTNWHCCVHVTDATGRPVRGIRVTLTP